MAEVPPQYSVVPPDYEARPGESPPRRNPLVADGQFTATYSSKVHTLYDNFESALHHLPINSNLGIYSINRLEWVITEQACYRQNLVSIPLYDTLGEEAIVFIVGQTEMTHIVASKEKVSILARLLDKLSSLKVVISMDPITEENNMKQFEEHGVELLYFGDVEAKGAANVQPARPPQPLDLFTICYTSGTTGRPKGVMLPHRALLSDASATLALMGYGERQSLIDDSELPLLKINAEDVHLSYLPLAHIFERLILAILTALGASSGFYQGDPLKILDDLADLRPTIFVSVPRLLNRVHEKVTQTIEKGNFISRFIFNSGYESKLKNLQENGILHHWFWDRLVFSKIANKLGGRVRLVLSGAAPISPEVMNFLRVCLSCEVYEGYGQTETSAATTLTKRGDWTTGHIGGPIPTNEIKLVDVPEMDIKAQRDNKGEICIRGLNCFTGYYKDPETTRETIDSEGWVHSGDIGHWDDQGRLQIVDRKKNIFKLSQGEYVAPEKIETVLCKSPLIQQCFVHGCSLKSYVVAIIVPNLRPLEEYAQENELLNVNEGIEEEGSMKKAPGDRLRQLCENEHVKRHILEEINEFKKSGQLKSFEVPKAIFLDPTPFSIDNGLLSPKFSLKRFYAEQVYRTQLNAMYATTKEKN